MDDRLVSREEAATTLGVSEQAVDKYVRAGDLQIVRLKRRVFIQRSSLEQFAARREARAASRRPRQPAAAARSIDTIDPATEMLLIALRQEVKELTAQLAVANRAIGEAERVIADRDVLISQLKESNRLLAAAASVFAADRPTPPTLLR